MASIVLAWAALAYWATSPQASLLDHDRLAGGGTEVWLAALVLVGGWVLMLVATMLPTTLSLFRTFSKMVARDPERGQLLAALGAGYLLVWTCFGAAVFALDGVAHDLVGEDPTPGQAALFSAGALVAAGAYQFSSWKHACLDKCRSPLSFIVRRWSGTARTSRAFAIGADHGLFCVGCCWALMLSMFAVGMTNLVWLFLLGAVMSLEKNAPWGRRLKAPVGAVLIGAGAVVAVTAFA